MLVLTWSRSIQDECICPFLKKADQFLALDVRYCNLVTNKLLNFATEDAKIRNSYNAFDFHVDDYYDYDTNINTLEKTSLIEYHNIESAGKKIQY